ncbi:hypothetical protein IQ13_0770 [Lacibacter cauensis]|uniref:Uncharacterized protein n=2 Tax=Lacibacter cauensis TaxID=510947 RepID=A0A562SWD0_9BACT|nr:hypothetical protein IQ13_0770 [Lacibacter cauensis]
MLLGFFSLALITVKAQVDVSVKTLDLESVNKHKNWKIIEAGIDQSTSNVYVKFASASCDIDKSSIGNTVTTTFKGLAWKVDRLLFDKNFTYLSTEQKSYANTFDAIGNNEFVYGRKFNVVFGEGMGTAISGVAMPTGMIDNSYIGTKIVTGLANISGFKIGNSRIGIKVGGETGKFKPDACFENPAVFKIDNKDAKEQKGQRWIPMFNHPIPNGGHILFNTSGVNTDVTKTHNVFRKYDADANVVNDKALTFDYQCLVYAKEIEMAPGVFDYVFVTLPINYKKSTGKVVPANQYEYIRIDGTTFETKHQLTFTAPHSQWKINQVFEKEGAVYLIGDAGKSADTYQDFSIPKSSDFPFFQIAKIQNGKLAYVSVIKDEQIKAVMQNINGEKVKPDMHLKVTDLQMNVVNGKFIYSGQQFEDGKRGDAIISAVFSDKGALEVVLAKSAEFSKGNLSFSADGKTMYWLIQDVTEYNKWDKKAGTITAKESKQLLTALSVVTYNLESKTVQYKTFINEEWGTQYNDVILYDTDNEIVLLGGKLTKKAKESELVFVTIRK